MPAFPEASLHELRLRYQAAHAAYQACVRAVTEATMSGELPSPALLEQEAKALGALTKTRASLLAAIAAAGGAEAPRVGIENGDYQEGDRGTRGGT